ncbi:M56 family metallopeptidase [Kitasatospora sp. NPDC094015]|uniref:M56 family metallopeptidase n=1 Tax=Kitasatospora sp. NPDC094015 TaxID=3155205 RepID=UPI00332D4C1A
MIAALLLALWAAAVTGPLPRLLAGAAWTRRAPAVGVLAWQALGVSAVAAAALAVRQLLDPSPHHHDRLLHLCGLSAPTATVSRLALAAAVGVALVPAGLFAARLAAAARGRRRHRSVLDLAARRGVLPGVLVLEHPAPAVYCLPGRGRRVVVSRGALDALTPEQLAAALAHEQGHLSGRHHLAVCAAEASARAFGALPLGRLVREETRLLLEMAADDRALRTHPARALAGAMGVVAGARLPSPALGAGHHAAARVSRLAAHRSRPPRVLRALGAAAAGALAIAPPVLACAPHLLLPL